MPQLLELQQAMHRSLTAWDDEEAAAHIVADGIPRRDRLTVYRNTIYGALTTALRLSYPAVHRLVGAEFFEGAAAFFIKEHPPDSAYLNEYGGAFPDFLATFAPAATLTYLPGAARLEWAVNRALHAPDVAALDLRRLSSIRPAEYGRLSFTPHPSASLVRDDAPVDLIWRAVLAQDDAAMAAIDLKAGPVWLLVQRGPLGVAVDRLGGSAWRLTQELFALRTVNAAVAAAPTADLTQLIAEHLGAGRFVDFKLPPPRRGRARGPEAHP